jgi:outer membrane protein TolC
MFEPRGAASAALTFLIFFASPALATNGSCSAPFTPERVVSCALAVSPEVQISLREFDALKGRRTSSGVWLPSNPKLSFEGGDREFAQTHGSSAFNWTALLSQEVEIADQRELRIRFADRELEVQTRRTVVTQVEVAAAALTALYQVQAADQELKLADRLGQIAHALSELAEQRANEGLLSPVDADVARAESVRIGLIRYEIRRNAYAGRANLNVLLGRDFDAPIDGVGDLPSSLVSPAEVRAGVSSYVNRAILLRGEVAATEAERTALEARLALIRRERVPNPTFSVFRQRDELRDKIWGGAIAMSVPLPAPIGQSRAGEIEESIARIHQAGNNLDLVKRGVRVEAARAYAEWQAASEALELFHPDLTKRSDEDLTRIREAIGSRQLSLRDALLAQRSLVELLLAGVTARLNYSVAWTNLMRVGGYSLPGIGL